MTRPPLLRVLVATCTLSVGSVTLPNQCVSAQGAAGAAAGLTTEVLSGVTGAFLIDRFFKQAASLMSAGQAAGDALLTNAGNKLWLATKNVDIALGAQRDELIEDLDPRLAQAFGELNSLTSAIKQTGAKVAQIQELFSLDLIAFTNRLPFTEKTDIYLSSVSGLAQIERPDVYRIELTGLGFGPNSSSRTYSLTASVNGEAVAASSIHYVPPNTSVLTFPATVLQSSFRDTLAGNVPLQVTVVSRVKTKKLGVLPSTRTSTVAFALDVALLPRRVGVVRTENFVVTQRLAERVDSLSASEPRGLNACRPNANCVITKSVSVPDNAVIERGVVAGTGNGSIFCYSPRKGGQILGVPDYTIEQGGRTIVFYAACDGAQPFSLTFWAVYRVMEPVERTIRLKSEAVSYGKPIVLRLSKGNRDCAYSAQLTLFTGQEIHFDSGMSQTPDGSVRRMSILPRARDGSCEVRWMMVPPLTP